MFELSLILLDLGMTQIITDINFKEQHKLTRVFVQRGYIV